MVQIDELQNLSSVACTFQGFSSQGVRRQRGDPLFENSVLQDQLKRVRLNRLRHFMLAARHSQDDLGLPAHGLSQGLIRGCIAGVQRHSQIDWLTELDSSDGCGPELDSRDLELLTQSAAGLQNPGVLIDGHDLNFALMNLRQQIVQSKSQVTLPRAKVHDTQQPLGREMGHDVVDDL